MNPEPLQVTQGQHFLMRYPWGLPIYLEALQDARLDSFVTSLVQTLPGSTEEFKAWCAAQEIKLDEHIWGYATSPVALSYELPMDYAGMMFLRINGAFSLFKADLSDIEAWCVEQGIAWNDGDISMTDDQRFAFRMRWA